MKRLYLLMPRQVYAWEQKRSEIGKQRYGERHLQRYNLVDVMEELLDALVILDRFEDRIEKQCDSESLEIVRKFNSHARLRRHIKGAIQSMIELDSHFNGDICTDEQGGDRIWWND